MALLHGVPRMKMGLSDKVIVITGAASGIGLAAARLAAEEGAGALLVTDRDAKGLEKTARELGAKIDMSSAVADLADVSAPAAIAAAAKARFGRIDGLVNAAGLTTRGSFVTGTAEVWDGLFAVNARAAFFLMQEAIMDMRGRAAAGSIVNILSMNAHCGRAELAIYAGTKGALATLTRNAANAHMAERIRVNGVNLGWVATESERRMQADVLGRGPGWESEESAKLPLGRLVTAQEAARLIVFLLGEASAPMSGSVIDFEQQVAGAIG
jgi:NAD(P)-dependent dehydrogenase (short-subunit alcohol dehydrogenase family)